MIRILRAVKFFFGKIGLVMVVVLTKTNGLQEK
jgi:hypothetical protein